MRRGTTGSALVGVILLAAVSAGQPPGAAADPTDALIQRALANDPDVQVARAKLALAEAEVAKARQSTVARVLTLRDTLETHRKGVARVQETYALKERAAKAGQVSREELLAAQDQLTTAQGILAATEVQFRLLVGDGPKVPPAGGGGRINQLPPGALPPDQNPDVLRELAALLGQPHPAKVSGPIPDRIRAALDKKVKFDPNLAGMSVSVLLDEFRKEAGRDVVVRPYNLGAAWGIEHPPHVDLTFGAWFQMAADDPSNKTGLQVYVRDYGLLIATRGMAPPDAVALTDFWRTRPAVAVKQPDPKPPAGKGHEFPHDKAPEVVKVKVGDVIGFSFPTKAEDIEEGKCGSNNPVILVKLAPRPGRAGVVVEAERAGKARVTWDVTDATGRRFTGGRDVEFE